MTMSSEKAHPLPCVNTDIGDAFAAHFRELCARSDRLLSTQELDVIAIHAGQPKRHFLDDTEYAFKPNPHFKAVCPLADSAHCWVIVRTGKKPTLVLFAPESFWHEPRYIDAEEWLSMFHVELISTPSDVEAHLPYDKSRCVYIGEHIEVAQALGIVNVNPEAALNYLHYHRLFKSDYELNCIHTANRIALRGHAAVEAAFYAGQSEFECWLAYMNATQQGPQQVPYEHIIGQNEHAAILHYRGKSTRRWPLSALKSLMIDAGADYRGYAADISRTYSLEENDFAELVRRVDQLTLDLITWLRPNRTYASIQEQTHYGVATILRDFGWVRMDIEQMLDEGVTRAFMPHSFGHMLGLQVHDVGGNLFDASGQLTPPAERFPTLKTNRSIEPRHVVTIEPGVYFIDSLLQPFSQSKFSGAFNWRALEEMKSFGGVRVEDNVFVSEQGGINLTRQQGFN